jgi:hypothetical protein
MLDSFSRVPDLSYPPTEVRRATAEANAAAPEFDAPGGWWLKRGDVHNTCAFDVLHARTWAEAGAIRRDFERREISDLVVQRHVDGDLIKFYGVGPGQWFTWFYHDSSTARRLPFELEDLAAQAELAASAVRVEVFGGDAIVTPEGKIYIIDINSWPSFARVRAEAAVQIARRLRLRLRQTAVREASS